MFLSSMLEILYIYWQQAFYNNILRLILCFIQKDHLKENIKLFSQSVCNTTVKKNNNPAPNTQNKKPKPNKNQENETTKVRKKQFPSDSIPDILVQSGNPIYRLNEESIVKKLQQSHLLPADLNLTDILHGYQNQPQKENNSYINNSESQKKMEMVMEQDYSLNKNEKENIFEDIQFKFSPGENNFHTLSNHSSQLSDIHMQQIEDNNDRWYAASQQEYKNTNSKISQEDINDQIFNNAFVGQPVDVATAEQNLQQHQRSQKEDLALFQKQSTRKLQKELLDENYFLQSQNSHIRDRTKLKIKTPKTSQDTSISSQRNDMNNILLNLNDYSLDQYSTQSNSQQNDLKSRQRGQKKRKPRSTKKKENVKVILDTSIDLKLNSTQNNISSSIGDDSIDVIKIFDSSQISKNEYKQNKYKQLGRTNQNHQPQLINQYYQQDSNFKLLDDVINYQSASSSLNYYFNDLYFLPQHLNFQSDISSYQKPIFQPLDNLEYIQKALNEIGYTHQNTEIHKDLNSIYNMKLNKDKSLNSSFSQPQGSDYSSIGRVMHPQVPIQSEKKLKQDEFGYHTITKSSTSKQSSSEEDENSQKSGESNKNFQSSGKLLKNQSQYKSPNQMLQLQDYKKNQIISHNTDINSILAPIVELQTTQFQVFQDTSSFHNEEFFVDHIYSQQSNSEIESTETEHNPQDYNKTTLSKEAIQLHQYFQLRTVSLFKLKYYCGEDEIKKVRQARIRQKFCW